MTRTVDWAKTEAERLVAPMGRRWAHVQAVAACAGPVATAGALDQRVVVMSAWLHDVGYAEELHDTGFHPVDGARHLRRLGVEQRVVNLVAHHSCARFEAVERGLEPDFSEEFARPEPAYEDALCYCDMTNGPSGARVTAPDRLAEIRERYGVGHVVTKFADAAETEILNAVRRVGQWPGVSESLELGCH